MQPTDFENRPWVLYWKLTPAELRHDLLIHCLQQTIAHGCVDAISAAYDTHEIRQIIAELTVLCEYD
jgi:hypothetical protein